MLSPCLKVWRQVSALEAIAIKQAITYWQHQLPGAWQPNIIPACDDNKHVRGHNQSSALKLTHNFLLLLMLMQPYLLSSDTGGLLIKGGLR